jgi:hypothetical protein
MGREDKQKQIASIVLARSILACPDDTSGQAMTKSPLIPLLERGK